MNPSRPISGAVPPTLPQNPPVNSPLFSRTTYTTREPIPLPVPVTPMNVQATHPTLPQHLCIWQQNLNTSHTAQLTLLNSSISDEWDILALQEPALNPLGNTRASTHWRVAYLTRKYTHKDKPRVVTLVNSRVSTNTWKQIPFPSRDVVVIQLETSGGRCTVFNIYNDNNHDETIEELERFLDANIQELRPAENDHMLWLGDFN